MFCAPEHVLSVVSGHAITKILPKKVSPKWHQSPGFLLHSYYISSIFLWLQAQLNPITVTPFTLPEYLMVGWKTLFFRRPTFTTKCSFWVELYQSFQQRKAGGLVFLLTLAMLRTLLLIGSLNWGVFFFSSFSCRTYSVSRSALYDIQTCVVQPWSPLESAVFKVIHGYRCAESLPLTFLSNFPIPNKSGYKTQTNAD